MSEPYIHTRSPDLLPAGSGPVFIFHGDVHGFTYSANPQGDLVSCMIINPATSSSPSGTPWSESLRRRSTSHAQSSSTASQTSLNLGVQPSEFSGPSVFVPQLSSSFEGNQDAGGITSVHSTPIVHYDFESSGGLEGASITSNRGLPTPNPTYTNLIDESKEFLLFLFNMYRRGLIRWFFQLGRQNAPALFY